jgi:CBS-domain-containing membrane protein
MNVEEVMTKDVITVGPGTPIHRAAQLMVEHRVSGLPVVTDDGTLVGIISEGDLILRQEPRRRLSWWSAFFENSDRLAREYQKAAGSTVGEVMTHPVITVSPTLTLDVAASILHHRGIRRLPVLADGRLVGIVSRGDLVKALAATGPRTMSRSDAQLVEEMKTRMAREPWATAMGFTVHAKDGVIYLWGFARSEAEKEALATMARAIEGARSVENHLMVEDAIPFHSGV